MEKEHLEVLLEDIDSKFTVILEGHALLHNEIRELSRKTDERFDLVDLKFQALNQKVDAVEKRLNKKIDAVEEKLNKKIDAVEEKLSKKIDAVAADLSAHRADTEAHHGVYLVKEEG